jgi:D-ribose pyranose/furanose isomerase RbsD
VEGLLVALKEWSPLVTVLGVGITIFLLGWRFPSKADVNRGDDNLQKQINQGIDLTLAVTKEIREDMRQMRSEIAELTGNLHTEIAKLADKIEANTHTIHERFDERTREIRSEIRELNKDYKAHLLQHAEKS